MAAIALDPFDYAIIEALPKLRTVARALTRSADDAEDLTQDTVVAALRHRDQFLPGTDMAAWLATIARNRHRSARRQDWRRCDLTDTLAATLESSDDQHARVEALDVMRAVEALRPEFRRALVDHAIGHSREEAAEIEGIKVDLHRSYVVRARRQVREALRAA